jgi:uncharacterized protein with HEPN domain
MSKAEDVVRIRHMLDAAQKAVDFTKNHKRCDLDSDEKLALSVVRLLEVLGEAAKSVSRQSQQEYPQIPWRQIAGTRDRLIHGYFDVDLDIVWKIVSTDLPSLVRELENALSDNRPQSPG